MIINEIHAALQKIATSMKIKDIDFIVEKTKSSNFGDFSSNIAMALAKQLGQNPRDIANQIVSKLKASWLLKAEVAGPGFINIYLNDKTHVKLVNEILSKKKKYGYEKPQNFIYNVEFVSANPTGHLHIGHARNAAFGDILSTLLETQGFKVIRDYIINDAGNQMNKLAMSTLVRYRNLCGEKVKLPDDAYHGKEIVAVAKKLFKEVGDKYKGYEISDEGYVIDKEVELFFRKYARDEMLAEIVKHCKKMGVEFDSMVSEQYDVRDQGRVEKTLKELADLGATYVHKDPDPKLDGAIFLRTTDFGDDKDRVMVKANGEQTYFAPDVSFHEYKLKENLGGADKLINIWGADHYSYIFRMKTALQLLGYKDALDVVCMQMVRLTKNGQEFKLSKRTGNSVRLIDLVTSLGKDAARWFLVSQSENSHIELDVDMATSSSMDNPLHYVQYAHARLNKLFLETKPTKVDSMDALENEIEKELLSYLYFYKQTLKAAAENYQPHKVTIYLKELAKRAHAFYANCPISKKDTNISEQLKSQRLMLAFATKQVIANGLDVLGIKAKTSM